MSAVCRMIQCGKHWGLRDVSGQKITAVTWSMSDIEVSHIPVIVVQKCVPHYLSISPDATINVPLDYSHFL